LLKKKFSGILAISLSLAVISTIGVYAETSTIPDWVKNNAKWWSEGQIGESDYISSLQYLINQEIIKIPITEVTAATTSLSDNDRAMSIVVHYDGEIFETGETIYTYSEFRQLSSTINPVPLGIQVISGSTVPTFYLAGLPSKDKAMVYRLVDDYVNPGRPPAQYNISVDVLAGDGKIIQTWNYRNCALHEYSVYLENSKETYRFSDKDDSEFREIISWECSGYNLTFP